MTVAELNAIIGVRSTSLVSFEYHFSNELLFCFLQQQMHAQNAAFPHGHPQAAHLAALSAHGGSPFGLPGGAGIPAGLLALHGAANAAAQQASFKEEKGIEHKTLMCERLF